MMVKLLLQLSFIRNSQGFEEMYIGLTGFKYIAEIIRLKEMKRNL